MKRSTNSFSHIINQQNNVPMDLRKEANPRKNDIAKYLISSWLKVVAFGQLLLVTLWQIPLRQIEKFPFFNILKVRKSEAQ